MNRVAVLMGEDHQTSSFSQSGCIKVFLKEEGVWKIVDEVFFAINEEIGIHHIREKIIAVAQSLQDCKIIIAKKVEGIAYNVLESLQFNIWEFEGEPHQFLDYVIEKEQEIQKHTQIKQQAVKLQYIEQLGEDYYILDLQKMHEMDRSLSSKKVLIPFLEKRAFNRLDIICSHIPPWIERQISQYALDMKTQQLCSGSYQITLSQGVGYELEG